MCGSAWGWGLVRYEAWKHRSLRLCQGNSWESPLFQLQHEAHCGGWGEWVVILVPFWKEGTALHGGGGGGTGGISVSLEL